MAWFVLNATREGARCTPPIYYREAPTEQLNATLFCEHEQFKRMHCEVSDVCYGGRVDKWNLAIIDYLYINTYM